MLGTCLLFADEGPPGRVVGWERFQRRSVLYVFRLIFAMLSRSLTLLKPKVEEVVGLGAGAGTLEPLLKAAGMMILTPAKLIEANMAIERSWLRQRSELVKSGIGI